MKTIVILPCIYSFPQPGGGMCLPEPTDYELIAFDLPGHLWHEMLKEKNLLMAANRPEAIAWTRNLVPRDRIPELNREIVGRVNIKTLPPFGPQNFNAFAKGFFFLRKLHSLMSEDKKNSYRSFNWDGNLEDALQVRNLSNDPIRNIFHEIIIKDIIPEIASFYPDILCFNLGSPNELPFIYTIVEEIRKYLPDIHICCYKNGSDFFSIRALLLAYGELPSSYNIFDSILLNEGPTDFGQILRLVGNKKRIIV